MTRNILLVLLLFSTSVFANINIEANSCIVYDKSIDTNKEIILMKLRRINDLYLNYTGVLKEILSAVKDKSNTKLYIDNHLYGKMDIVIVSDKKLINVIRVDVQDIQDNIKAINPNIDSPRKFLMNKFVDILKASKLKLEMADMNRSESCSGLDFLINGNFDYEVIVAKNDKSLSIEHVKDYGAISRAYTITGDENIAIAEKLISQSPLIPLSR